MALLALFIFASIGLQLLSPQIVRQFIDAVQVDGPTSLLARLAVAFIGVAMLKSVVALGVTYISEKVRWASTNALRMDLTAHCMSLDITFHHQETPGSLIERVDGDVTVLGRFFSELFVRSLANLLTLLGILLLLFQEGWQIGVAFTIFGTVALTILVTMRNVATPYLKAARESAANLFGFIEERIGGTEDIRANGAIGYTMQRLYRSMAIQWRHHLRGAIRNAIFGSVIVVWFHLGSVLALALGAVLYTSGTITLGTVYLLYAYVRMLSGPLMQLTNETQQLQEANAAILRVEELQQIQPSIRVQKPSTLPVPSTSPGTESKGTDGAGIDGAGTNSEGSNGLAVEFEEVAFAYPVTAVSPHKEGNIDGENVARGSDFVLQRVSFDLAAGQRLGIVGRTGSGKSTIARLLARLYDPNSGTIRLEGQDIRSIPVPVLRRKMTVVTQDVHLFNGSIRDNLTLFDAGIGDDSVESVIRQVGLANWLRSQTEGLDTILQRGGGLSAGQAQLLAFARSFLRQPKLVVLDEASSRLDPETERLIQQATEVLLANRTAIIIAHHLSTLDHVDDILVMEQGHVVEHGKRERLVADPNSRLAQMLMAGAMIQD